MKTTEQAKGVYEERYLGISTYILRLQTCYVLTAADSVVCKWWLANTADNLMGPEEWLEALDAEAESRTALPL